MVRLPKSVGRAGPRLGFALALAVVGASVFVGASGATGVGVSWSAPMQVAPLGGQGYMTSVSCPTASQCTAVDWSGQELTFDPHDPGSAVRHVIDAGQYGQQLQSVDCVSTQQCTAVEGGNEVTFNPVSGTVTKAAMVAPITNLFSVSCPTASLCVAGGTSEVAFNPLTAEVTPAGVTDFRFNTIAAISCVSATQCTSVEGGFARTFDPATGQLNAAGIVRLNGGTMASVTCPTATECVGGDGSGNEIPFNPITGAFIGPGKQSWGMGIRTLGISCRSASSCTGVDYDGGTRTFDPTTGTLADPGETDLHAGHLQSVVCLAANCVAVSSNGNEVTFDPTAPGAAVTTPLDTARQLSAISCPSATQCTAVSPLGGEATFDPTTGSVLSSNTETLDKTTRPFLVVACPSTTQCTAVLSPIGGPLGETVTFNPQTGAANDVGLWAALGTGSPIPAGIACPSVTECIELDNWGDEVAFDPTTGVRMGDVLTRPINERGGFASLACPTTTQCTAMRGSTELTWNPTNVSFASNTTVSIDNSGGHFYGLACPSAVQCTGVGSGSEVTFDPQQGVAIDGGRHVIDGASMSAVSCPSTTLCVAVDLSGRSVAFDPAGNGARNITPVPQAASLYGVACVSTDTCIATDGVGQAFSGTTVPVLTPDTEIASGPDNDTWTTHATFVFSSHDPTATFKCSLDGADPEPCVSPASYSGLTAATHTFEVQAQAGGLSDPNPPSASWTIRISDVGIQSGPSDPSPTTSAAFSFSSDDPAATFRCSLDSSPWATCTSPKSYQGLDPGSHTFAVEAVNDGGEANPNAVTHTWHIILPEKLTVIRSGSGVGSVVSSPAGIACGSVCSVSFGGGTSVTLTAKAARAAVFSGWSGGGCSGIGQCIVVMNDVESVTATFTHMCVVPSVVGKKLAGAKSAILTAVCAVGTVTTKHSKLVPKGYVISQSPTAGKKLPDGTPVNLVVSLGKATS